MKTARTASTASAMSVSDSTSARVRMSVSMFSLDLQHGLQLAALEPIAAHEALADRLERDPIDRAAEALDDGRDELHLGARHLAVGERRQHEHLEDEVALVLGEL